jgi:hypothetical protein
LLNICVVILISMKQSLSLFTSLKVLAVHASTILRTKNVGLEAFTVLLKTTRFFTMAPLVMFY